MTAPEISRLARQLSFIAELDGLKNVLRRTCPIGLKRRENSAEHSWQVVLSALVLAEHANEAIDLTRVLKMLTLHDVVELYVGDTFHYNKSSTAHLYEKELAAAERIFGQLPVDQCQEFLALWNEFAQAESADAKFANAVDRLQAFILNPRNNGGTWIEHALDERIVREKNQHIEHGSVALWEHVQMVVDAAVAQGHLLKSC